MNRVETPKSNGDCFAVTSQADLVETETSIKLLGGALHRSGDAILFQASAPLHTASCKERARYLADIVFRGEAAERIKGVISPISLCLLEEAMISALYTELDISVKAQDQTDFEKNATMVLQDVRYGNVAWRDSGRSVVDLDPN